MKCKDTQPSADWSRTARDACRRLRDQQDMWQRAAVGVLVLSITGNVILYDTACSREARHREETEQLRTELRHVEAVRDQAVQKLGELSNSVELDKQARREQAEAYEAIGAYQYVGECTITAYCPCAECCGRWADGLTATGFPALPGVVAVDPDVIPLGSTVIIDGQKYLAADTGIGVTGNHIDICLASHEETVAHGVHAADVWMVTGGGEK